MVKIAEPLPSQRDALRALTERLDVLGYLALRDAYGYENTRSEAIVFDLPRLPREVAILIDFLEIGNAASYVELTAFLPKQSLDVLVELGLVEVSGGSCRLSGLRLVIVSGSVAFVEQPSISRKAYFGNDTLALSRLINRASGSALDLCCGVGMQALRLARTANKVIGVDINPQLRNLFEINSALNGISDRVEFRNGSLFEPVIGESFDIVTCNPPLLPVPNGVGFPFVGDGGNLGIEVTEQLCSNLKAHLNPGGRLVTIGSVLGDADGPFLGTVLERLSQQGLSVFLILPFRQELKEGMAFFDALVRTAAMEPGSDSLKIHSSYLDMLKRHDATHIYSFLLTAIDGQGALPTVSWSTEHYLRSDEFWSI